MKYLWILVLILLLSGISNAVEYECRVEKKFDSETVYPVAQIQKAQYSVLIEENEGKASLSRCSFSPSKQAVTCDRYEVDKIILDQNAKIKKFYVFPSQFDVQLFPNLTFVENNGRGGIAYGKCNLATP